MSRHTGFRLMMAATLMTGTLGYDPFDHGSRVGIEDLPDHLYRLLPEHFDVSAFNNMDAPPALFGFHWSGEIRRGLAALAELPSERVLTLRYEDIQADPAPCLRQLIEFIDPDLVDDEWIRASAAMVRPARSSWRQLARQEQQALSGACQPGFLALNEYGMSCDAMKTVAEKCSRWHRSPVGSPVAA